jgi:hypothetical protein
MPPFRGASAAATMAFQFQCPQDHLLEGEESQAGQAINCPVCGMLFIIPEPIAAAPPATPAAPEPEPEPELLHIACPNGHVLEVPPDMLDTEVLCPHCNEQFRLRAKDSIEHRKRREQAEAIRDAKTNKFYYQFAIVVVSIVALLLLTLMVMSIMNQNSPVDTKPQPQKKAKTKDSKPKEKPPTKPAEDEETPTEEMQD